MAANVPHHKGSPSIELNIRDEDQGKQEIPPKNLNIIWGQDSRYWNVPEDVNSPAVLYQVCWLEVTCCIDKIRPDKEYEIGFNLSLTPDAFGWGGSEVFLLVKRGKGKFGGKKMNLDAAIKEDKQDISVKLPKAEEGSGEVPEDSKAYFGLYEVWSGKWKGGLKIHHAFIRQLP